MSKQEAFLAFCRIFGINLAPEEFSSDMFSDLIEKAQTIDRRVYTEEQLLDQDRQRFILGDLSDVNVLIEEDERKRRKERILYEAMETSLAWNCPEEFQLLPASLQLHLGPTKLCAYCDFYAILNRDGHGDAGCPILTIFPCQMCGQPAHFQGWCPNRDDIWYNDVQHGRGLEVETEEDAGSERSFDTSSVASADVLSPYRWSDVARTGYMGYTGYTGYQNFPSPWMPMTPTPRPFQRKHRQTHRGQRRRPKSWMTLNSSRGGHQYTMEGGGHWKY